MESSVKYILSSFFLLIIVSSIQAQKQETTIMIRAQAKDAKFIGSSIGGAKILVKNALTNEILAEGVTTGSTGNTKLIMNDPQERNKSITTSETAGFLATLNIEKPLFVTIEAFAPINKKQASVTSSTQLWIIPGKNITGDGVVLEIPGFIVDILSPQTHEKLSSNTNIEIKANVVMMCGCPVTDNGMWDASKYQVNANISNSEGLVKELELKIGEKPSTFSGTIDLKSGLYEILVYSFDPFTGNSGVDKTNIIVD